MLRYAMLRYASLLCHCYAMLHCYAVPCYAVLCYNMLCYAMLCFTECKRGSGVQHEELTRNRYTTACVHICVAMAVLTCHWAGSRSAFFSNASPPQVIVAQAKGIAKRLTPILVGVREEVKDDKYTLVCGTCNSVSCGPAILYLVSCIFPLNLLLTPTLLRQLSREVIHCSSPLPARQRIFYARESLKFTTVLHQILFLPIAAARDNSKHKI